MPDARSRAFGGKPTTTLLPITKGTKRRELVSETLSYARADTLPLLGISDQHEPIAGNSAVTIRVIATRSLY